MTDTKKPIPEPSVRFYGGGVGGGKSFRSKLLREAIREGRITVNSGKLHQRPTWIGFDEYAEVTPDQWEFLKNWNNKRGIGA